MLVGTGFVRKMQTFQGTALTIGLLTTSIPNSSPNGFPLPVFRASLQTRSAPKNGTLDGKASPENGRVLSVREANAAFPPLPQIGGKIQSADNGPGLIVCEPVAAPGTSAPLTDFGAGCGRWLHLMVSGQGAMSKTPLWNDLGRAARELKMSALRLAPEQALPLGRMTGITHVLVGRIDGTDTKVRLTYQLYHLPSPPPFAAFSPNLATPARPRAEKMLPPNRRSRKLPPTGIKSGSGGGKVIARSANTAQEKLAPVGMPFVAEGKPEEILAALPRLAQAISARLLTANITVPALPDVTVEDMTFLGHVSATFRLPLPDGDTARLVTLTAKTPLAAVLLLANDTMSDEAEQEKAADALLTQLPTNGLAFGLLHNRPIIAYQNRDRLAAFARVYPHNFQMEYSRKTAAGHSGDWAELRRSTDNLVRDNPANPTAWAEAARSLGDIAEAVREGRVIATMTESELDFVGKAYQSELLAAARAVTLDDRYSGGWYNLALSATFAGQEAIADRAIHQALQQDKPDVRAFLWALEMYQPKWLDHGEELDRIANRAAQNPFATAEQAIEVAVELQRSGYAKQAQTLLTTIAAQCRAAITRTPGESRLYLDLAAACSLLRLDDEALLSYRALLKRKPGNSNAAYHFGEYCLQTGKMEEAFTAFEQAAHADPWYYPARYRYGMMLEYKGRTAEAIAEQQAALRAAPTYIAAYLQMSETYELMGKPAEAVAAIQEAIAQFSANSALHERLGTLYFRNRRYRESVEELKRTLELNPLNPNAQHSLEEAMKAMEREQKGS